MSTVRPAKTITWVQTVLIYLSGKVVISETFLSSHPRTLQSHEKEHYLPASYNAKS